MSGFAHDIAGGQGNLIATSMQSPNFVAGSAGWQVRKDGSVEFNNGTFRGTVTAATIVGALIESAASGRRTTMDSNGDIKVYNASGAVLMWFQNSADAMFFYADTGSSTQGVLITSIANAAGTDPFGTAFVQGLGVYAAIAGQTHIMTMGTIPNFAPNSAGFYLQVGTNPAFIPPLMASPTIGTGGTENIIASGASLNTSTESFLQLEDSTLSGTASGVANLSAGIVTVGASQVVVWSEAAQQLQVPAGSLVATVSSTPETWHNMPAMANGWSVGTGFAKYQLTADGFLAFSFIITNPGTKTDGTLLWAAGSLPSAYQTAHSKRWPISMTPAANSTNQTPWLGFLSNGSINVSGINTGTAITDLEVHGVIPLV